MAAQAEPSPTTDQTDLGRLWEDFRTGSPAAREQLILHYAPLVKYVAGRLGAGLPQSVEQADLVSNGMFGLMDALAKFDPARAVKFETYAIPRIRGPSWTSSGPWTGSRGPSAS